jgi:pyruvate kinase
MLQIYRATKIVATLGPASSDRNTILALARAGANVFRLNFSHGSQADHQTRLALIRSVEAEVGWPLGVMQDLQGPKIRLGVLPGGPRQVVAGEVLVFSSQADSDDAIAFPHPDIAAELQCGHHLLVDDGKVKLVVSALRSGGFDATVITGGILSDRKGVNLPDTHLSLAALTAKDREDLAFGLALGVDWVALSFVQRASDIAQLRQLVGKRIGILAKIEKPNAIGDLDAIVQLSDAVMVARGDLGVEMQAEEVPGLQRKIIAACRRHGKPVVVATQMLESMISSPTPTRAEASDVANAVYSGADAVMLSAETASGAFAVLAVETMAKIVTRAENDLAADTAGQAAMPRPLRLQTTLPAEPIASALRAALSLTPLSCAVTFTMSGASALLVARERAGLPIIGLTPLAETARRLCLAWGVHAQVSRDPGDLEEMIASALAAARSLGLYSPHQAVAVIAGLPFGTSGSTNTLRFIWPTATPELVAA